MGDTIYDSVPHHEIHLVGSADIGDGIAGHGDYVGEFAGGEHTEITAAEQFCGNACARFQGAHGTQARLDHCLEFQDAMAERKHAAIRAIGDLYSASGEQTLGRKYPLVVAAETSTPPGRVGCQFCSSCRSSWVICIVGTMYAPARSAISIPSTSIR
jgi:hypothetical protein